jgi:hypothetical protein
MFFFFQLKKKIRGGSPGLLVLAAIAGHTIQQCAVAFNDALDAVSTGDDLTMSETATFYFACRFQKKQIQSKFRTTDKITILA